MGDLDDSDEPYGWAQGGSFENIDRLLGTGSVGEPGCTAWVLVGESWFIVANDDGALGVVEEELGGVVKPVQRVSPPASYGPPGCGAPLPRG